MRKRLDADHGPRMPRLQDIWTALRLGGSASTAWGSTCCEVIAALMATLPSEISIAFLRGLVQSELGACSGAKDIHSEQTEDGMRVADVEERLGNVAYLLTAILRDSCKPPPPPPPPKNSSTGAVAKSDSGPTPSIENDKKRSAKRSAAVLQAVHGVLEELVWLLQVQYLPG